MVQRASARQQRLLCEFGGYVRTWRKLNRVSATDLTVRAFVTRETLRHIENGTGSPRSTRSSPANHARRRAADLSRSRGVITSRPISDGGAERKG